MHRLSPICYAHAAREQRGPPHWYSCSVGRADVLTCAVKPGSPLGYFLLSRRFIPPRLSDEHSTHAKNATAACLSLFLAQCSRSVEGSVVTLERTTFRCVRARVEYVRMYSSTRTCV
jgi:hypothetical protein